MSSLFLLSECLENIFLNFTKYSLSDDKIKIFTKDLYSCTLVSRHWCRISTPFLYTYPFHYSQASPVSYFKLIRTLLSCAPQFEIEQIYTSHVQVLSAKHIPFNEKDTYSNLSPTFNYVSFIRGFVLNEMIKSYNVCYYKNVWLSAHNPERISPEQTVRIMNHFVKFMCKYCDNLTMVELSFVMEYSNVINLSQFTSISLQNRWEHIVLSEGERLEDWDFFFDLSDYSNVLSFLSTQNESLQTLEINYLTFNGKEDLNLLYLPKKISELKLHYCKGVKDLIPWAKSLTKLKALEIVEDYYYSREVDDFLIQLFKSSSNTLTKLVINITKSQISIQIIQQIPLYLHSLNHLELPRILSTDLIFILKSCTKLVYLSVILDDEEDLEGLDEFVPETLDMIRFKLIKRKKERRS